MFGQPIAFDQRGWFEQWIMPDFHQHDYSRYPHKGRNWIVCEGFVTCVEQCLFNRSLCGFATEAWLSGLVGRTGWLCLGLRSQSFARLSISFCLTLILSYTSDDDHLHSSPPKAWSLLLSCCHTHTCWMHVLWGILQLFRCHRKGHAWPGLWTQAGGKTGETWDQQRCFVILENPEAVSDKRYYHFRY